MDIDIEAEGFSAHFNINDLPAIPTSRTRGMMAEEMAHNYMGELGREMVATAEELIDTSIPQGNVYHIRGYGYHVASAPGQPPAILTGQLRASFYSHVIDEPEGPMLVFGNDSTHIEMTELGTVKMAPRPVIREARDIVLQNNGISKLEIVQAEASETIGSRPVEAGPVGHSGRAYAPQHERTPYFNSRPRTKP